MAKFVSKMKFLGKENVRITFCTMEDGLAHLEKVTVSLMGVGLRVTSGTTLVERFGRMEIVTQVTRELEHPCGLDVTLSVDCY